MPEDFTKAHVEVGFKEDNVLESVDMGRSCILGDEWLCDLFPPLEGDAPVKTEVGQR